VLVLLTDPQDERQRSFLEKLSESNYEGVDSWEGVVLAKLPSTLPPPPDLCTNRSIYTVPDTLAAVCARLSPEDSAGMDETVLMGDEHWAPLQRTMVAHVQERQQRQNELIGDANRNFPDIISDYSSVV
jgi:hypothetical protein